MPDTHLQALSNAQTIRESKGRSIIAFPDTYCVIDVETTGRSPSGTTSSKWQPSRSPTVGRLVVSAR